MQAIEDRLRQRQEVLLLCLYVSWKRRRSTKAVKVEEEERPADRVRPRGRDRADEEPPHVPADDDDDDGKHKYPPLERPRGTEEPAWRPPPEEPPPPSAVPVLVYPPPSSLLSSQPSGPRYPPPLPPIGKWGPTGMDTVMERQRALDAARCASTTQRISPKRARPTSKGGGGWGFAPSAARTPPRIAPGPITPSMVMPHMAAHRPPPGLVGPIGPPQAQQQPSMLQIIRSACQEPNGAESTAATAGTARGAPPPLRRPSPGRTTVVPSGADSTGATR